MVMGYASDVEKMSDWMMYQARVARREEESHLEYRSKERPMLNIVYRKI